MAKEIEVSLKYYDHPKFGPVVNRITCDDGEEVHNSTCRVSSDYDEEVHIEQGRVIAMRYREYKFNYENPLTCQ